VLLVDVDVAAAADVATAAANVAASVTCVTYE